MSVLISCESGGDLVPAQFIAPVNQKPSSASLRARKPRLLPGRLPEKLSCDESAIYAASRMADRLNAPLIANEYSPDLINVSRSLRHRQLFPKKIRSWPAEDRQCLIDQVYQAYRKRLRETISNMLVRSSFVIHLSISTFDLRCNGKIRRTDAGLLYDPSRDDEVDTCLDWIYEMYEDVPMLRVRRNYPRRGTSDNVTQAMRGEFSGQNYIGLALMLNRAWVARTVAIRREVIDGICTSLQAVVETNQLNAA